MTFKQKIDKILTTNRLGIHSLSALEDKIGVGRNTLKKAYEENREPTLKVLVKLYDNLGVNETWFSGSGGEIFRENHTSVGKEENTANEVYDNIKLQIERGGGNKAYLIPFYDTVAVGGLNMLAEQEPLYSYNQEMIDPGTFLRKATGALRVYGHSMFPKYPAGCVVAFKEADIEVIFWGEDYVVELHDRRVLKRIEKSALENTVKLVSYNKSEEYVYADVEVPVAKIKRLYMVVGKVEMEASV